MLPGSLGSFLRSSEAAPGEIVFFSRSRDAGPTNSLGEKRYLGRGLGMYRSHQVSCIREDEVYGDRLNSQV